MKYIAALFCGGILSFTAQYFQSHELWRLDLWKVCIALWFIVSITMIGRYLRKKLAPEDIETPRFFGAYLCGIVGMAVLLGGRGGSREIEIACLMGVVTGGACITSVWCIEYFLRRALGRKRYING